jgi:hypothetical protein
VTRRYRATILILARARERDRITGSPEAEEVNRMEIRKSDVQIAPEHSLHKGH